jgi:hypothetical protein
MVSILRVFPNHLVSNTFKLLMGCRYITKTPQFDSLLDRHKGLRQNIKKTVNLGKFNHALVIQMQHRFKKLLFYRRISHLIEAKTQLEGRYPFFSKAYLITYPIHIRLPLHPCLLFICFEVTQKHFSFLIKRNFKE